MDTCKVIMIIFWICVVIVFLRTTVFEEVLKCLEKYRVQKRRREEWRKQEPIYRKSVEEQKKRHERYDYEHGVKAKYKK